MTTAAEHNAAQKFEAAFWGDCTNTYAEETKQHTYAELMGMAQMRSDHWPTYDVGGCGILDIGGGPTSLLLKTINRGPSIVVDPLPVPGWVKDRYELAGIFYAQVKAETYLGISPKPGFDEAWIYNVLQHVRDPQKVIETARREAKVIRIFEWVDMPAYEGHPHTLQAEQLHEWLGGGQGHTIDLDGVNGCYGRAFYGQFST
jgi:hypothetical protein